VQSTLGAGLDLSPAESCTAESDTVDCASPSAHLGGLLLVRWRALPELSVGLLGALATDGSRRGQQSSDGSRVEFTELFWRVSGEARYHFDAGAPLGLWAALELGMAGLTEQSSSLDTSGDETASSSVTQEAFAFGPGFGGDVALGRYVGLGASLRSVLALFPEDPPFEDGRRTVVGTSLWVFFTLDLTFNVFAD
jgi:hypothetical protein